MPIPPLLPFILKRVLAAFVIHPKARISCTTFIIDRKMTKDEASKYKNKILTEERVKRFGIIESSPNASEGIIESLSSFAEDIVS